MQEMSRYIDQQLSVLPDGGKSNGNGDSDIKTRFNVISLPLTELSPTSSKLSTVSVN